MMNKCANCGGDGANRYQSTGTRDDSEWVHSISMDCIKHLRARAEAAEGELTDLQESLALQLGMDTEYIAAHGAERTTIEYLINGYIEANEAHLAELAALRAELAQGWRPVTEKPSDRQRIEILIQGEYFADDNSLAHDHGGFIGYLSGTKQWRHAPPNTTPG